MSSEKSLKIFDPEIDSLLPRKQKSPYIKYVPFICVLNAGVCGCYYGLTTILYVYLRDYIGFGDRVGESLSNMFIFLTYTFTLVGGIVADVLLGPFKVLLLGSLGILFGTLAILCAELFKVYSPQLYVPLAMGGITLFFLGNGFMKPCLSAFLGDQFAEDETEDRSRWFSWFYLTIQFGSVGFSIGTPLSLQNLHTWITFVIILAPLLLGTAIFIIPHISYRKKKQGGNVFATFIRILITGMVDSRSAGQRHWLDKTKAKFQENEVEDAKVALKVLKIMIPLPFFWSIFFQMYSIWVKQAQDMNRTFGSFDLPASETSALNGLIDIFLIPLFENLIYPFFSKPSIMRCFKFTPLRRMAAGHLFTIAALVVAGYVSKMSFDHPGQIHIAYIIPQYFLISCAEILLSITGLDFAYKESPASMKGTMTAVYLSTTAIGNALISVLALMTFDLWIEDFALAIMIFCVFLLFTAIASSYTYREDEELAQSTIN